MSQRDDLNVRHVTDATVIRGASAKEDAQIKGLYTFECFGPDGKLKWQDTVENVIINEGKNLALDTFLAGSAYTVTGPYMGLISSVGFGAGPAASDTMANHPGWVEAGGLNAPTYTAPRPICAWSAASGGSKTLSTPLVFHITGTGTVKGSFIAYGSAVTSVIDATTGTLWSSGLFTGGDKSVANNDTINVSYSVSM